MHVSAARRAQESVHLRKGLKVFLFFQQAIKIDQVFKKTPK